MLACVTDCEQINQNPSNNSSAKQLYSFPRGPRFVHYKKPYSDNIYETKSQFKKRKRGGKSMGFGVPSRPELFPQKEQIQKPPPDTYTLETAFQQLQYPGMQDKQRTYTARKTRKGMSYTTSDHRFDRNLNAGQFSPDRRVTTFGVGRSAYDKVVSPLKSNFQPHDRSLPGPGYYAPDHNSVEGNVKFSLRPQTRKELFKILQTPGPGTYMPIDGINNQGMYAKSGHMRTQTPSIRRSTNQKPTKHDRVPGSDRYRPGPGWYDHSSQTMSVHLLKKALPMTHTRLTSGFGKQSRKVFVSKSITPGPGSYLAPSAFGQYVGERVLLEAAAGCERTVSRGRSTKQMYMGENRRLVLSNSKESNSTRRHSKPNCSRTGGSSSTNCIPMSTASKTVMSALSKHRSGTSLTENLTATERKIIRKLKESARGKKTVAPVQIQSASRIAHKMYGQQYYERSAKSPSVTRNSCMKALSQQQPMQEEAGDMQQYPVRPKQQSVTQETEVLAAGQIMDMSASASQPATYADPK